MKVFTLFFLSLFAVPVLAQDSIDELQTVVNLELKSKLRKEYFSNIDEGLDLICEENGLDNTDKFSPLSIGRGLYIGNFEEFLPGLKRHKAPKIEELYQMKNSNTCDHVITLNAECEALKIDPNKNGIVDSEKEREIIISRASEIGLKDYHVRSMLHFYEAYGKICINANKTEWHTLFPVLSSTSSLKYIFQALELIFKLREKNKSVCFHCHAGKHRTGITAMLLTLADLDEKLFSNEDKMKDEIMPKLIQNYYEHTWNGKCSTKSKVVAAVSIIIKSNVFLNFRDKWQQSFK